VSSRGAKFFEQFGTSSAIPEIATHLSGARNDRNLSTEGNESLLSRVVALQCLVLSPFCMVEIIL
jgi:hypothetical protein